MLVYCLCSGMFGPFRARQACLRLSNEHVCIASGAEKLSLFNLNLTGADTIMAHKPCNTKSITGLPLKSKGVKRVLKQ